MCPFMISIHRFCIICPLFSSFLFYFVIHHTSIITLLLSFQSLEKENKTWKILFSIFRHKPVKFIDKDVVVAIPSSHNKVFY